MMSRTRSATLALLVPALAAACTGDSGGKKAADPLPPVTVLQPIDAGAPPPTAAGGVTQLPAFDPDSGFHLDDAPSTRPGGRLPPREKKVGQILLRSSPTGAMAAVDGVRLGPTPVLWEGLLDGQPREFTFVMAGHALARYRFVPITNGIVHGTLVKITDDKDAGVPEIPQVVPPPRAPGAPPPPAVDAAVPPTPTVDAPLPPSPVDAGTTGLGPGL
jgi:hypothetical protein